MDGLFPFFPVFLDLTGRPVVLLGGNAALARLAEALLASGAGVTAIGPAPSAEMRALNGALRLLERRWKVTDMHGAALVVAAADAPRVRQARIAAHGAQAIFHQLGAASGSDVALGAALARGPLAVGLTAQGLPAALEGALRARIEEALPSGVADFLAAAISLRQEIDASFTDDAARAAFWRQLAARAFAAHPPDWRVWIERELSNRESAET